jgi:putative ABC transport system permease protein
MMFRYYLDLSWRSVKRTPLVSTLMILAIGIGIGVTMICLSVYHMMSLDPIPAKSNQLYSVQLQIMDDEHSWHSSDNLPFQLTYQDAKNLLTTDLPYQRSAMFKSGFSVHLDNSTIKPFSEVTRVTSRDIFSMFNLSFVYGGVWSARQELNAAPVVVIAKSLNDKLFGGANSVGKTINLDQITVQIVGVIHDWPTHIKYYDLNNGSFVKAEKIFLPFSLVKPHEIGTWGNTNGWKYEPVKNYIDLLQSEKVWIQFWVELPTAKDVNQFENFLMAYMQTQQEQGRFNRKQLEYALRDIKQVMRYRNVVSEDNEILVALSFMFLVVCLANILALLLAKFLKRAPEVGVRRALGASKGQVFYQHLVEVALLGAMGGIIGIAIAQLGLLGVRQSYEYYDALATMDTAMLLAAPLIAISTCIMAGLYPAWLVCNTTPATHLKTQ